MKKALEHFIFYYIFLSLSNLWTSLYCTNTVDLASQSGVKRLTILLRWYNSTQLWSDKHHIMTLLLSRKT